MGNERFRRRRHGFKMPFIFVLIIISLIFIFIIIFRVFIIKIIDLKINNAPCVDEKGVYGNTRFNGENLLFLDTLKVGNYLGNKFICIKKVNFTKKYPDKINVEISGRVAKFSLEKVTGEATASSNISLLIENYASESAKIFEQKSDVFLADDEGVIFSQTNDDINIPLMYFFTKKIQVGEKIEKNIILGFDRVLNTLNSLNLLKNNLFFEENQLLAENNGLKMIFNLDKDLHFQIASLQLILQKAKIENEDIDFVDLRYEKAVVKFKSKKIKD